jgi:hypothetical protein
MLLRYFSKFGKNDLALGLTRDYYQLVILNEIFNSKFRTSLVLRGIGAAKHAYSIGDGDEKIELASLKKPYTQEFLAFVKKVTRKFKNVNIIKTYDRRYIYAIEIEVDDIEKIKIVIEISKIKFKWKRGINYDVKVFKSEKWEYKILGLAVQLSELVNKYKELSEDN